MNDAFNIPCEVGMADTPDKFYDLAICDVPYGIGAGKMPFVLNGKKGVLQSNGTRVPMIRRNRRHGNNEWDTHVPPQSYFDELCRVSRHQIVFGIDYCNWEGVGTGRIKWDKRVPAGMSFNRFEVAYCSMIDGTVTIPLLWAGMMQAKSLKEPTTQQGNKKLNEVRIHHTHKPVLLYKRLMLDFANQGWKILDTHLGGGSSRIAAYDLGLDFVGYEIDKKCFDAQEERFKNYILPGKLFAPVWGE